jgi:hypothetical protein
VAHPEVVGPARSFRLLKEGTGVGAQKRSRPLGALYYTLVTPERVSRLSRGEADGSDAAGAIEQLVQATVASLQAPALDRGGPRRILKSC